MAHSGDAYISYFAFLYRLKVGDYAYITYNGKKYTYQVLAYKNVKKVVKKKVRNNNILVNSK